MFMVLFMASGDPIYLIYLVINSDDMVSQGWMVFLPFLLAHDFETLFVPI